MFPPPHAFQSHREAFNEKVSLQQAEGTKRKQKQAQNDYLSITKTE
jgi:hypothetical protein